MESLFEPFTYPFFLRALIGGSIVGVACSVCGVFVVLRGIAFIGAGISHSAFAGVALGLLFGVNPVLSAVLFCAVVALGVSKVTERGIVKEDTAIGVFFAASMALGVILLSFAHDVQVDIVGYLFGSILSLANREVTIAGAIAPMPPVCSPWSKFNAVLLSCADLQR